MKSSDASVGLIWKCFVHYVPEVFFFLNVALTHFFFWPSVEIVRIHNFYTLEYHSPLWARLCSVSIAGAEEHRGEWRGNTGCMCHSLVLFPFSCDSLLRSVHKSAANSPTYDFSPSFCSLLSSIPLFLAGLLMLWVFFQESLHHFLTHRR